MMLTTLLILFVTGILCGVMNALAGGGTFIAFPVLIFLGLPPISANATATVGVWPGTLATMFAYRRELALHVRRLPMEALLVLIGSAVGAIIVLHISNPAFIHLVPYLLLMATLLFTFRNQIVMSMRLVPGTKPSLLYMSACIAFLMLIALYGGFFGAGMGILLLAYLGMSGMHHMHEMNAVRSTLGLASGTISLVIFAFSGVVGWLHALALGLGAMSGGYLGAYYARRLPQAWSRNCVIAIGWGMTLYFFWKTWKTL